MHVNIMRVAALHLLLKVFYAFVVISLASIVRFHVSASIQDHTVFTKTKLVFNTLQDEFLLLN